VRLFAVDCKAEVEKIARAAPGSRVFCRILSDCVGAEWPLSRKFGCEPAMAVDVLEHATGSASSPTACRSMSARSSATSTPGTGAGLGGRGVPRVRRARHEPVDGQPRRRLPDQVPEERADGETYGSAIFRALRKHFGNRIPETIIEPGRGMVGNAGVIEAEVVLVSKKSNEDDVRWVYLDIGKFGGLAETMDESIRYPIQDAARRRRAGALRARRPDLRLGRRALREAALPAAGQLEIGDKVLIEGTGAYTATYASVAFNGFAPLKTFHI
jgi:ornithine decarboxylase